MASDMVDQPYIVVFPRGQLSPKDKERMTKAGVIAVEADSPKDVVQLKPQRVLDLSSTCIDADDVVRAAISALANYVDTNSAAPAANFVKLLNRAINPPKPASASYRSSGPEASRSARSNDPTGCEDQMNKESQKEGET